MKQLLMITAFLLISVISYGQTFTSKEAKMYVDEVLVGTEYARVSVTFTNEYITLSIDGQERSAKILDMHKNTDQDEVHFVIEYTDDQEYAKEFIYNHTNKTISLVDYGTSTSIVFINVVHIKTTNG